MTSVASRAIFIQTYPGLKSLSESKLLLAHLQRFGRVATFRNLRVRLPIQPIPK
jgi:ABC-type nitrate/sulfonate/bicarbonate transport system permease component